MGKVLVSGYITSEEEKSVALKIVQSIKGVKELKEDIQVVNYKAYKEKM